MEELSDLQYSLEQIKILLNNKAKTSLFSSRAYRWIVFKSVKTGKSVKNVEMYGSFREPGHALEIVFRDNTTNLLEKLNRLSIGDGFRRRITQGGGSERETGSYSTFEELREFANELT